MSVFRTALVAGAMVLFAACSGGSDDQPTTEQSPTVELPAGVTLSKPGTDLTEDESATVLYQVGSKAQSAITVTVTEVRKGKISDFKFFSLDEEAKKSSPFYVKITVQNEGPAGLGGAGLPIYAHDSTDTIFPPNELVGKFKPCLRPALPKSFLPGSVANLCLVYLIPEGRALQSVDLQTGESADAISWTP